MLARRLLQTHPTIKIILMSATMHTMLYKDYFSPGPATSWKDYGDLECLSVGARRFPVQINYQEEIVQAMKNSSSAMMVGKKAESAKSRGGGRSVLPVIAAAMQAEQYKMAVWVVRNVAEVGTAVKHKY